MTEPTTQQKYYEHSIAKKKRYVPIPVSKSDLREIKSLKNPPAFVKKVGKAFMIVMKEGNVTWEAVCRYLINSSSVYGKITTFPRNGLSEIQRAKLKDLVLEFNFTKIQQVSLPVSNLALWMCSTERI